MSAIQVLDSATRVSPDLTAKRHPRIISSTVAAPSSAIGQDRLFELLCELTFGREWAERTDVAESVHRVQRLFASAGVRFRHFVIDPLTYFNRPRSTQDRMESYERYAYPLARQGLEACIAASGRTAGEISDFFVVSCTGYTAPGLDISLARDLGFSSEVRRVIIGHMGCYGALVGLRDAQAALASREGALAALLSVELCSLHFSPTLDTGALTSFALFGDASAAVLLSTDPEADGPELVDAYSLTDFDAMDQMSWRITDEGFVMGLSARVPVTLGRNVGRAMERLLAPHNLQLDDIAHWLIHPGGPSILQAIQRALELRDDAMALSWQVLREHGNCSSPTILIVLDRLLRSGRTRSGEWGVMMAFGPGLTLETCLLRF